MFVILNLPYPPPLPPCNRNRNRLAFPASAHAHRQTIVVAGNATPLSSILVLGDNTTPVGGKKNPPASRYMQLMVAVRHAASTFRVWITVACDAREEDLPLDRKPRVPPRQRCVLDCRVRRHAQRTPFPPCYAHPAATCQPCAATCFC